MRRWGWIAAGALGVLVFGLAATAEASESCEPGQWSDADAPRRIRAYASVVEHVAGLPGLGEFLVGVAYRESRGNSRIVGDQGRAYGWFQLHESSRCFGDYGVTGPQILGDEALQVAMAACKLNTLARDYSRPGQRVTFEDIRNGWDSPSLVKQSRHNPKLRPDLCKAGARNVADLEATPRHWPGVAAVLAAVRGVA